MTAMDVLERCRSGEDEIETLTASISLRRTALERCTQQLTGMPGGGGVKDTLSAMVCEIADLEKALDRRKRAYAAEVCAGVWIVETLPDGVRDVLRGWYIEKKSLGGIARSIHYSESTVKRMRADGEAMCRKIEMETLPGFLPEWYETEYRQNFEP